MIKKISITRVLFGLSCFLSQVTLHAQVQKGLDIAGKKQSEQSGHVVDMPDSRTLAISAFMNPGEEGATLKGQARVYSWNGVEWKQKGSDIAGENNFDQFGYDLSMPDAFTIAVGAPNFDSSGSNTGQVKVYRWNGKDWEQKGDAIIGESSGDNFGHSVCMPDSNTVVAGSWMHNLSTGQVRVFTWDGSEWKQKGSSLVGEATSDFFGISVSMPSTEVLAVGAWRNDGNRTDAGHVRIFRWDGSDWVQKGVDIDGEAENDRSGFSVSMPDENTVAIGAASNNGNNKIRTGHVRVYSWNGTSWVQKGVDLDGDANYDNFGYSISMADSNTLLVGAFANDVKGSGAGLVRLFNWDGKQWKQEGKDLYGDTAFDQFGWNVSMANSNTFAVGANFVDIGPDPNIGKTRVFTMVPCSPVMDTINPAICGNVYTSPSGHYTWEKSGTYYDVINNIEGCDSIVYVINLTVNKPTVDTVETSACSSYTSPSGKVYTESGLYVDSLVNISGCDSLVYRNLTINSPTSDTTVIMQCDAYDWEGKTFTETGIYSVTYETVTGCDSVKVLDFTLLFADITTTLDGATITSEAADAEYQWLDCNQDYAIIEGETGFSFTATENGDYAVEVVSNGCKDTSACVTISGLHVLAAEAMVQIFPNPTEGNIRIELGSQYTQVSAVIYDATGKVVGVYELGNGSDFDMNMALESGIYYINIESEQRLLARVLMVKQ